MFFRLSKMKIPREAKAYMFAGGGAIVLIMFSNKILENSNNPNSTDFQNKLQGDILQEKERLLKEDKEEP